MITNDTTTRTDAQVGTHLAASCWYREISHSALVAMSTPELLEVGADLGLSPDEMGRAMRLIGRLCKEYVAALRAYQEYGQA